MYAASRVFPPPFAPTNTTDEPGSTLMIVWPAGVGMGKANDTFVALMSHGITSSHCNPLKHHRNVCDKSRHEAPRLGDAKSLKSLATPWIEPATFSLEGRYSNSFGKVPNRVHFHRILSFYA
jgi:hypothetical protein